ncbi:MAG: hypothetical protein ACOYON_02205 [Fimbriimonas sp.]
MKGAIVGVDPYMPLASVVIFQYNPDTLTRSIRPHYSEENAAKSEILRLSGAPDEQIRVEIDIDATDQLGEGDELSKALGITPQLSALELLAYPKSPFVIANTIALAAGMIEVVPTTGPFTLFVWGPKRVLPVRVNELSITEEMYDPQLNPIRAKASLTLKVLSYNDLPVTHPGYYVYLAHQILKEAMGNLNSVTGIGGAVKDLIK